MNIFVDENVPQQIVALLRAEGHKVEYVTRQVEDRIILDNAYKQQALLITSDKDFERLVLAERRPTVGVILLRVSRTIPIKASKNSNECVTTPPKRASWLLYNTY